VDLGNLIGRWIACLFFEPFITNINTLTRPGSILALYVDFTKAFDSVWRPGLLCKLQKNKITGKVYQLIQSICENSSTQVKLPEGLLPSIGTYMGVR
jgi:hypothetical protein